MHLKITCTTINYHWCNPMFLHCLVAAIDYLMVIYVIEEFNWRAQQCIFEEVHHLIIPFIILILSVSRVVLEYQVPSTDFSSKLLISMFVSDSGEFPDFAECLEARITISERETSPSSRCPITEERWSIIMTDIFYSYSPGISSLILELINVQTRHLHTQFIYTIFCDFPVSLSSYVLNSFTLYKVCSKCW